MEFEEYIGEPDKERYIRALRREEVDRVPNLEGLIEDQHVEKILGRYAGNTISVGGDLAKGEMDVENTRPMHASDFLEVCKIIGQDVMSLSQGWTPFKKIDENGKLIYAFDKSVKNIKDFRKLILPGKKEIDAYVGYIKEYKDAVKGTKIGITSGGACFFQTLYEFVVGMEDFMMACYENIEFIEEMLDTSVDYWIKFVEAVVNEGICALGVGDDVAFKTGLFIPYPLFKKIWVPRMAKIIKPALEAGIPVQFHSDGKIDDIIEDLIEMGVNCINPMDPYCIDYREYKKKYGNRIALSGNIDVEFPLAKGTPQDVERDVKEHMEVLKPGYGYVAGSSHSIVNYIPYENFVTMINAIHKYGIY